MPFAAVRLRCFLQEEEKIAWQLMLTCTRAVRLIVVRPFASVLQACGTAEFPLPRAQYALRNDESQLSFGSTDETPFHLHLDQLNICLDL